MIYLPLVIPLFFFFSFFPLSRDNLRMKRTPNLSSKPRAASTEFPLTFHFVGQTPATNDIIVRRPEVKTEKKINSWNTSRDRHTILNRDACTIAGSRLPEGKPNRKEASLKSSLLPPPPPPSPLLPPPPLL